MDKMVKISTSRLQAYSHRQGQKPLANTDGKGEAKKAKREAKKSSNEIQKRRERVKKYIEIKQTESTLRDHLEEIGEHLTTLTALHGGSSVKVGWGGKQASAAARGTSPSSTCRATKRRRAAPAREAGEKESER